MQNPSGFTSRDSGRSLATVEPAKNGLHITLHLALDAASSSSPSSSRNYPAAPSEKGVSEVIHGVRIDDPWRGLEEEDAPETIEYVTQQNLLAKLHLLHGHPSRNKISKALEASLSFERSSCPLRQADGYYYWEYNSGLQPRDVLMRSRAPPSSPSCGQVVYDGNSSKLESLYTYSWSQSGRLLSLILQESGSDCQTIRTIDTSTGKAVEADLHQSKFTFGVCFLGEEGYLYKRVLLTKPGIKVSQAADGQFGLFYHAIGHDQSEDALIWTGTEQDARSIIVGRPYVCRAEGLSKSWLFVDFYRNANPETEALLVEHQSGGTTSDLAASLHQQARWISKGFSGLTTYIGTTSKGVHFFLSTCGDATRGQVIAVSTKSFNDADPGSVLESTVAVEQDNVRILTSVHLIADRVLLMVYLKDACAQVTFYDLHRSAIVKLPQQMVLPVIANVSTVSTRSDATDFYLTVETFLAPPYILRGNVRIGIHDDDDVVEIELARLHETAAVLEENPVVAELTCKQEFYFSNDGIQIPLFLCHASHLDMSKPRRTLLYAYGGFGALTVPQFDPFFVNFMRQMDGVLAVACIRGGGEYGKEWHQAAAGSSNRTVSFDDFCSAARYLHLEGISVPSMTAAFGTSNGGTLVAASMLRHPELFQVVLPNVGIFYLVRFHLFTLGRYWTDEYGDPEDAKQLPLIDRYSPVHNVNARTSYPAVLITSADHDTRVVPMHSLKMIAALQTLNPTGNISLCRIYENTGHEGSSQSTAQKVEEIVDRLIFLSKNLE